MAKIPCKLATESWAQQSIECPEVCGGLCLHLKILHYMELLLLPLPSITVEETFHKKAMARALTDNPVIEATVKLDQH